MVDAMNDQIIWQSAIIPELQLTASMLTLLQSRHPRVSKWQPLMLDLEEYLVLHPDKRPKDYKRFILNCARRRAEDIAKGFRRPDGSVDLQRWKHRQEAPPTDGTQRTKETLSLSQVLDRARKGEP